MAKMARAVQQDGTTPFPATKGAAYRVHSAGTILPRDVPFDQQAKELEKLKLGELRAKYNELFGVETRSINRPYLIKKILQAKSDEIRRSEVPGTSIWSTASSGTVTGVGSSGTPRR